MATSKIPQLNDDTADKLLANVFDACEMEHNSIPLVKLASYSEYRREKYSMQKIILSIVLIVFCALPLCFISPDFTVQKISPDDARFPEYEIHVKKFMPVSFVSATLDGKNQAVYETGERTYGVQPTENGKLDIRVQYINRQYATESELADGPITVEGIDVKAPVKVDDKRIGDELFLWFSEEGSGIDYENVTGYLNSGEEIKPIRWDEENDIIVFEFPSESANLFIPDKKGNELQLVITVS